MGFIQIVTPTGHYVQLIYDQGQRIDHFKIIQQRILLKVYSMSAMHHCEWEDRFHYAKETQHVGSCSMQWSTVHGKLHLDAQNDGLMLCPVAQVKMRRSFAIQSSDLIWVLIHHTVIKSVPLIASVLLHTANSTIWSLTAISEEQTQKRNYSSVWDTWIRSVVRTSTHDHRDGNILINKFTVTQSERLIWTLLALALFNHLWPTCTFSFKRQLRADDIIAVKGQASISDNTILF